jgi:hypothetical protein
MSKRDWQRRQLKRIMDVVQQLFIVGTLGSLFVFVPLHGSLGAAQAHGRHPVALSGAGGDGDSDWLNPAYRQDSLSVRSSK